jgi:hypothetical protein
LGLVGIMVLPVLALKVLLLALALAAVAIATCCAMLLPFGLHACLIANMVPIVGVWRVCTTTYGANIHVYIWPHMYMHCCTTCTVYCYATCTVYCCATVNPGPSSDSNSPPQLGDHRQTTEFRELVQSLRGNATPSKIQEADSGSAPLSDQDSVLYLEYFLFYDSPTLQIRHKFRVKFAQWGGHSTP